MIIDVHLILKKNKHRKVYERFNKIGWENVKIILIEHLQLNDRYELYREEDKYIQKYKNDPFCLNMHRSLLGTDNDNADLDKSIPDKTYNKYNDSKIYRMYSDEGYYYYGSTIRNIVTRLCSHINDSRRNKSKLYEYFQNIGWNNAKIELINSIDVNSKKELLEIENDYIKKHFDDRFCLNSHHPIINLQRQKETKKRHHKELYEEHKEEINKKGKEWRENNKEKVLELKKQYYQNNRKIILEKNKNYSEQNREKILQKKKDYYKNNKEKRSEYEKQKYKKNKESILARCNEYREMNRKQIREKEKEKIICMCGSEIMRANKARHEASIKHQEFLNTKQ